MTAKKAAPQMSNADLVSAAAAGGNVDKIRDILFGGQMRDYDRRFTRVEDRITQETTRVRDEFNDRVRDLEEFIRSEMQKLSDKIQHERKERTEAESSIGDDLKAVNTALGTRVTELDDQVSRDLVDVRNRIRDESRQLTDALRDRTDQLAQTLERDHADLADDKVGRDDLASLFTEVSMRLNRQFELPEELITEPAKDKKQK